MKILARKLVFMLLVVVSLSGCANLYPLPVHDPAIGAKPKCVLQATGKSDAAEVLKTYGDKYLEYADELRRYGYILGDASVAGGLVGTGGGLVGSPETAIAGGLLSWTSSMIANRYRILVQALNYENAAKAMYCMHDAVYVYKGNDVHEYVNININRVRHKLREKQASLELINPDLKQLESIIIEKKEKRGGAGILEVEDNQEYLIKSLETCVAAF